MSAPSVPVAVTGIAPVSRPAIGVEALRTATLNCSTATCRQAEGSIAATNILEFDNFDPTEHLGRRGWKYLPVATRLALASSRMALRDAGRETNGPHERTGVAIGTNFAVSDVVERIDHGLLESGVGGISAVECPNFAVNLPASQVSIAHGLRAFNVTLVDLLVAGIQALLLGVQALKDGRADAVLAGAVEGLPPAGAADVCGHDMDASGACMFYLESHERAQTRGVPPYGWITGGVRRFLSGNWETDSRALADVADWVASRDSDHIELCGPNTSRGRLVLSALIRLLEDRGSDAEVALSTGAQQGNATSLLTIGRDISGARGGPNHISLNMGPLGHLVGIHYVRGPSPRPAALLVSA